MSIYLYYYTGWHFQSNLQIYIQNPKLFVIKDTLVSTILKIYITNLRLSRTLFSVL